MTVAAERPCAEHGRSAHEPRVRQWRAQRFCWGPTGTDWPGAFDGGRVGGGQPPIGQVFVVGGA